MSYTELYMRNQDLDRLYSMLKYILLELKNDPGLLFYYEQSIVTVYNFAVEYYEHDDFIRFLDESLS